MPSVRRHQDWSVPRYAQGPDLAPAMARLVDALGANRARLAIVQFLRDNPGADRSAITSTLGIGHQTVYSHLTALETVGLIYTDTEAGERHGRTVHYWVDIEALREAVQALLDELDSSPKSASPE